MRPPWRRRPADRPASPWAAKMAAAADALMADLARLPEDHPRRRVFIEGPRITADDWDGPNLKPGVLERFDAELAAMVDHLRSLP